MFVNPDTIPRFAEPDPEPEPRDEEPVCRTCVFCKDLTRDALGGYCGTCVVEVYYASTVELLDAAEISTVDLEDEACRDYVEAP